MLSDAELAEMRGRVDEYGYDEDKFPIILGRDVLELLDEVDRLKSALSEYADESNWSFGEWMMPYKERWGVGDGSSVARMALGQTHTTVTLPPDLVVDRHR